LGRWGFVSWLMSWVWYVLAAGLIVIFWYTYYLLDFLSSDFEKSPAGWELYSLQANLWVALARGITINLLSASLAYVFVKGIYDFVQRKRGEEERAKFFEEMGDLFTDRVEGLLSIQSVKYFEESYYDIDWKTILAGTDKAQVAAAYWSTEWMKTNLSDFTNANRSTELKVYLTHPYQATDAYGIQVMRQNVIRTKILDCALEFAGSGIDVHFLDKIPSYMYCATQSKGTRIFLFSPYQMGNQNQHGRSPVIGLNLGAAGDKVLSFVEGEIAALESSTALSSLNLGEHLHWSEDETRVVVSLRLSCELGCKFCYVPSLQDSSSENAYRDQELFGFALAQSMYKDQRFVPGRHGTKIMVGGMTDPFLPKNARAMTAFLEQLAHLSKANPVHIASRLAPKDQVVSALSRHPNAAVSSSIAHFDEAVAADPLSRNLERRLQELRPLQAQATDLSIYLRPIVPELTERALTKIMDAAKSSGITKVILGNLYVDTGILKRSGLPSSLTNKGKILDKKMIVDPSGRLKKVNQEQLRQKIKSRLEENGFEVFGSSGEYIDALRESRS